MTWKIGDRVSLPHFRRQSYGTITEIDRHGRYVVWWQDGSGGNYWPEQLVETEVEVEDDER